MNALEKIMAEPILREDLENEIFIINNRLKSAEGSLVTELKERRSEWQRRLDMYINARPEDIIEVNCFQEPEVLEHKFTSSLYREDRSIQLGGSVAGLTPFNNIY